MTDWTVYGLIDPADEQVFYIGCSYEPKKRIGDHSNDRASAAYWRCRDIIERGDKVKHCLFASGIPKEDARILEARLVLSIPTLTNSKAGHVLPLSASFERKWLDLSSEIRSRVRHNFNIAATLRARQKAAE